MNKTNKMNGMFDGYTENDITYLVKLLNDKFDNLNECEDCCPYKYSCNILIKQDSISFCGVIELMILGI